MDENWLEILINHETNFIYTQTATTTKVHSFYKHITLALHIVYVQMDKTHAHTKTQYTRTVIAKTITTKTTLI